LNLDIIPERGRDQMLTTGWQRIPQARIDSLADFDPPLC
jgi:hypothetical protein